MCVENQEKIEALRFQEETLFRVDLRQQEKKEGDLENILKQDILIKDLLAGSEQLLFSFIVPSTFCSTDNINELQKLVTQGCNKLQRKLLFADSLAQLPYKIGVIRGILSNLVNVLKQLDAASRRGRVDLEEIKPAHSHFIELQRATEGLCRSSVFYLILSVLSSVVCRGQSSLPALAVDLQKSCDLLQVPFFLSSALLIFFFTSSALLIFVISHFLPIWLTTIGCLRMQRW